MNVKLILKTLGKVLYIQAAYMTFSVAVSLYYMHHGATDESLWPFLIPIAAMLAAAVPLTALKVHNTIFNAREGMVAVALIWVTMSVFGAVPFAIHGGFGTVIDCFFESASGFSTTGASILREIEHLPKSILFWRSATHWLGGMGILVLALALFPSIGERAQNLMAAESPGPTSEKLTARISTSSKILYAIYTGLTLAQIICLLLAGLGLYDAVVTALATAGTGGFSVMNASMAGYSNVAAEVVTTVFMGLFGINFTVFFLLITGQLRKAFRNSELLLYLGSILGAITLIALNIYSMYGSLGETLRYASFNAVSVITTTGFSNCDFARWPTFSHFVLVLLMLMGASAGSTGGGIKGSRVLILLKSVVREIKRLVTPKRVSVLRMNGKPVPETTVTNTLVFTAVYALIALGATLIVSACEQAPGYDFTTNVTAIISCLSNIGPALGRVAGPAGNYAGFSQVSKLVLSVCMLTGRLEIFPMIVLLTPATWKNASLRK